MHVPQTKTINTCPDVWKLPKALLYYVILMFDFDPSTRMDTAVLIKMVSHFLIPKVYSPVQSSFNTQPQITLLHHHKHQCDDILIQCCSRLRNEVITVHIFLVHFCQRTSAYDPGINSGPTFQSHILDIITERMQVVLLKYSLRRLRYIVIRVFIWKIEHLHFNIAQELVILSKYYNDGNFKVIR